MLHTSKSRENGGGPGSLPVEDFSTAPGLITNQQEKKVYTRKQSVMTWDSTCLIRKTHGARTVVLISSEEQSVLEFFQ